MRAQGNSFGSQEPGRGAAPSLAQRGGWIGIALGLLLLWLAFRRVPMSELGEALAGGQYVWLVPLAGLELVGFVGRAVRWQALLALPGILEDTFWAQSVGFIFTNLLPFRLGEAVRVVVLGQRARLPVLQVAASAGAERVLDVAAVLVMLVLVLPAMAVPRVVLRAGEVFALIVLAVLLGTALVLVFRRQTETVLARIQERHPGPLLRALLPRWRELVDGLAPLSRPKVVVLSALLSAGIWGLYVLAYWCVLRAFRPDATVVEATFMVIALSLAISLPSSPGFIGVFQFAGQQALVLPFGGKYDPATALAATLAAYLVWYALTTVLGGLGMWKTGGTFAGIGRLLIDWRARSAARSDPADGKPDHLEARDDG
jgi:uncharacterized protein (TIRG00374 family)